MDAPKDSHIILDLERRGAALGLKPDRLWAMAEVDRTIWYRIGKAERWASRGTIDKLTALGARLSDLEKMPKRKRAEVLQGAAA
jgi:hypothetical protein